jgi:hypothetical protein
VVAAPDLRAATNPVRSIPWCACIAGLVIVRSGCRFRKTEFPLCIVFVLLLAKRCRPRDEEAGEIPARRWDIRITPTWDSPGAGPMRSYRRAPMSLVLTSAAVIGRSYLSHRASAGPWVRPPFQPCVRIFRTRLTKGHLKRGITQPPGSESSRAGMQPEGVDVVWRPVGGLTGSQVAAVSLPEHSLQPPRDVVIDLSRLDGRVRRATCAAPGSAARWCRAAIRKPVMAGLMSSWPC